MTSEKFRKTRFHAGTLIEYKPKRNIEGVICCLCEVDFDEEILTIWPIDKERYEQEQIQVNIKHCEIYDPKIKKLHRG